MSHITSYVLGGLAAAASWSMVAPPDSGGGVPSISAAFRSLEQASSWQNAINRAVKSDRLAPPRPSVKRTVASIEVVGVHDTAIIYRDRDGNILYRTDPVNNVTVIAKGVKLPDITVRDAFGSSTRPVPVEVPENADQSPMPIGCEPAASPVASPRLSHIIGRCISQREGSVEVATTITE